MNKNGKNNPIEKKSIQCPSCGKIYSIMVKKMTEELEILTKKLERVYKSDKSAVEKKLELFEVLEKLDFGEISPSENKRVNNLLQSR